jgi:hypothetical protein
MNLVKFGTMSLHAAERWGRGLGQPAGGARCRRRKKGGTRWGPVAVRERGGTNGAWAGPGKGNKMGQAQRNNTFFIYSSFYKLFEFDSIKSDLLVLKNFQIKCRCVGI